MAEVFDFGKEKRDRSKESREITEAEALKIADDVMEKFPNNAALEKDFLARAGIHHEWGGTPQTMEQSLETQRRWVKTSTPEQLIEVLERHDKNPNHYIGTVVFAAAEELLKRFPKAL